MHGRRPSATKPTDPSELGSNDSTRPRGAEEEAVRPPVDAVDGQVYRRLVGDSTTNVNRGGLRLLRPRPNQAHESEPAATYQEGRVHSVVMSREPLIRRRRSKQSNRERRQLWPPAAPATRRHSGAGTGGPWRETGRTWSSGSSKRRERFSRAEAAVMPSSKAKLVVVSAKTSPQQVDERTAQQAESLPLEKSPTEQANNQHCFQPVRCEGCPLGDHRRDNKGSDTEPVRTCAPCFCGHPRHTQITAAGAKYKRSK